MSPRWRHASPELRDRVEKWLGSGGPTGHDCEVLDANPQRRTSRISGPSGDLVLKLFHANVPGRSTSRRALKALGRALGRSSADREWRGARRLYAAGLPVAQPLGRANLRSGDELLVFSHLSAQSLALACKVPRLERRARLAQLGALVLRLHRAGFVHGDLHEGNVLIGDDGPHLLDLQRVRSSRSADLRLADIAALDLGLARVGLSHGDRLCFRAAASSLTERRSPASRKRLRAIGGAAEARARRLARSRTRRLHRAGDDRVVLRIGDRIGLRLDSQPAPIVEAAVAAHQRGPSGGRCELLKDDHRARVSRIELEGRRWIVKQVVKGGLRKRFADVVRGSPGRRAWIAGHGLSIRGVPAATPIAFLERRCFGCPSDSLVILEDLAPAQRADTPGIVSPERLCDLLLELLLALHRAPAIHGDLQSINILVDSEGEGRASLIDLESVRFPVKLADQERIQALAEINASLDEASLPASLRSRAFERYANALPFRRDREDALREIVRRSLERGHVWQPEGCPTNSPAT